MLSQNAISNFQDTISKNFIKLIQDLNLEDLNKIEGIGEVVAESIFNYFNNKKNIEFINKLFNNGVEIEIEKREIKKLRDKIFNKIFVLTGSLKNMSRDEAKERIRNLGGQISSSVSKNTDYVVAGKDPGSKHTKAKQLGINILNEKEFLGLLK